MILFYQFQKLPSKFFLLLLVCSVQAFAQQAFKGKLVDAKDKSPLIGATVQIKGSKTAVLTDVNGDFALNQSKFPFTLKISYLGYETKEQIVQSDAFLTISVSEDASILEEVVISSGYTVQNKSEFSGAVSNIGAKQMANRPAISFDQLLSGQAPGIDIIQPTSILNNTPVMRVRGINTITSGLFPLVVVDGVTVFVGSIGGMIGNNPLSDINPNDIQDRKSVV